MLDIVECGFADPSRETERNAWDSGPELDELPAMPDFPPA